ncbi:two-component response regulator [Parascardovia denticolens DSM 10105 = JCM 12538]|nr:hypothetical protein HMPREF9017_01578 [Parascardovia denticolens F0305]BAR05176.1 two-component response regulator [Parascardovia denticolens DSM 10105 = JCM 12538]
MLTVAIVEDEPDDARRLDSCLQRYGAERGVDFRLEHFGRPSDFLDSYKARYDLVFMDIEMPGMDGLSAAKRLRQFDQEVILIFVTNLAQYASRGYEVNALDYVMKPMEYQTFERKMDRAVRACRNNSDSVIVAQRGTPRESSCATSNTSKSTGTTCVITWKAPAKGCSTRWAACRRRRTAWGTRASSAATGSTWSTSGRSNPSPAPP